MRLPEIFRWINATLFQARQFAPVPVSDQAPESIYFHPVIVFSTSSGSGQKRTVRAERRRRDDSSGARPRAEAPERQRESEGGTSTPAPTGSSGGSTGGGTGGAYRPTMNLPGGQKLSPVMMIGLVVIACVCVGLYFIFGRGGTDLSSQAPAEQPAEQEDTTEFNPSEPTSVPQVQPTRRPQATLPPGLSAGTAGGDTWTVMLYQDADDKILEQDIYIDLNEAERVGSGDGVQIVAQFDRYRAGYTGDGDWTSAKRFYVTQDNDLNRVGSEQVADLGEVNMSDGNTLVDFVTWAMENYPADKYTLILSDHGLGWPGGWSDPTATGSGPRNLPLAQATGDQLFLMEIDQALGEIRAVTGLEKFEMIGMDACLMGHLEVFSALQPHARYAVASQETEPSLGWAYAAFLNDLRANPGMSGGDLGEAIVDSYIDEDQRIVDNQARAEFAGGGSILGSLFGGGSVSSAEQIVNQLSKTITLTAADLGGMTALMESFNNFSALLQSADQNAVAQARSYSQAFTSIFGKEVPASYLDLGNFVQQVASRDPDLQQAAGQVLAAIQGMVISEKHGPDRSGATGVSIYFPNSKLYGLDTTGARSYVIAAERFANQSLWDDFMAYHYTGRSFDASSARVAEPEVGDTVESPAAGGIQVSPLTLSTKQVAPGETVLLSADIQGENIGYIKLFVGYMDQASNSIFVADSDYLESSDTRQIDGVYYPEWGEGEFTLEFEWEPVVFGISDGTNLEVALFTPESYGKNFQEAEYSVDGVYTFADDAEQRNARLYFQNGVLQRVFGFTGESETASGTGAPREITPQPGDTFTILDLWYDLDSQGNVTQAVRQEGGTLTFGDQMFEWEDLDAAAGQYLVGFLVEDLDGNPTAVYETVTVEQ